MLVLITNDDGINAQGLDVLKRVAMDMGADVFVVAPETEQSGSSHAITLLRSLRLREVAANSFALDGTPVDCLFIAVNHILHRKPDLVLSGINRGPNLGFDVIYSGTAAAAVEGALKGIPSIALSLVHGFEHMDLAAKPARTVIDALWPAIRGKAVAVNVNIPDAETFKGYRAARLGRRIYSGDVVVRTDPRGRQYLWIGGSRVTMDNENDTDCGLIQRGYVTVSPIALNLTDSAHLGMLNQALAMIGGDNERNNDGQGPDNGPAGYNQDNS